MLEVVKLDKVDTELIQIFNLEQSEEIYSLELDKKNIGYGIIRNNPDNNLEIYILKQYQSNGYGTYLFSNLLKIMNKETRIKVKIENIVMLRIVSKFNGIETGRDGQYIYFVIPKIEQ